jgi:hypothetical protein
MRSHCCLCVSAYPPTVAGQRPGKNIPILAGQRLGRNVTAVTNTHATTEKLLDASFSIWPVSNQGKQATSSSQNFLYYYFLIYTHLYSSCSISFSIYHHIFALIELISQAYYMSGQSHLYLIVRILRG